jgi:hypothetical protein
VLLTGNGHEVGEFLVDKGLCNGLLSKGDGVLLSVSKGIGDSDIGSSVIGDGRTIDVVGLECCDL